MDTCNCQCVFNVVFLPCWMLTLQHKCCFSIVDYKVGTKRTFLSRRILSSLLSNPSSISYSMYPYLMEQLVQVAKKKKIRKIIVLISEQECKTWVLEILIHISDVCDLTCSDFLFNFHLWDLVFWLLLLSLYGKRADKALVSPLTDFWFWLLIIALFHSLISFYLVWEKQRVVILVSFSGTCHALEIFCCQENSVAWVWLLQVLLHLEQTYLLMILTAEMWQW